ncbi:MAG: sensor histidine kinase, partial [Alcaligenes sp.]
HEPAELDIRVLLADLHDYYDVLAEQRGLVLQTRIEDDLPLMGDRALLFQALVNLADNAIKYAPSGTVVTLLARRRGAWIELGAADEGPGIDADQRGQAVQRFRRLTRDRTISGHGLGLALVHAVAALHGGSLVLADNDLDAHDQEARASSRGLLAVLRLPCRSAAGRSS